MEDTEIVRLVGLWTEPDDTDAFEREYLGSHFPLLADLGAVTEPTTSRCIDGPYYRMTELSFRNLDDINDAMQTPKGRSIRTEANKLADKFGIRLDVLVVASPS